MRPGTRFSRRDLHDLTPGSVAEAAVLLSLPHVAAFLASVDELQRREPGRNSRGYLAALLNEGSFPLVSPVTGRVLRSGGSIVLVDRIDIGGRDVPFSKVFAFSFPWEPDLVLGIGDVGLGYPVCCAILRERCLLLGLAATDWGFNERHLARLGQMYEGGWAPALATGPLYLVLGDANFAHHAWNQLSGLEEIAAREMVQIVATHQPLGTISALYPELACPVLSRTEGELEGMNRTGALFAPVGGCRLSRAVIARVLALAAGEASRQSLALAAALRKRERPVLWMSVRTQNRTPVNQHALLMAVARAFTQSAPDAAILIDGFSRAGDLQHYSPHHREEAALAVAGDRDAAEAIRLELMAFAPPNGGVHVVAGLTVSEAILLAQQATVYFCHHGTLQHKVGWFSTAPGVVHCNRGLLALRPAGWVAAQSEIAAMPAYLPAGLVDDFSAEHDALARRLRHEDYVINDIPAAVAFFMDVAGSTAID